MKRLRTDSRYEKCAMIEQVDRSVKVSGSEKIETFNKYAKL